MENAINGMAGALNGIKDTNEKNYERAYDSWKENMKLAEQRHKMQHEAYTDALALGGHDANAGAAKLRMNAVRFGDQQALMLLEGGYSKELQELIDARNKSMIQSVQAADTLQERGLQQELLRAEFEKTPKTGDPRVDAAHKLNAFQRALGQKQTPQQELLGQYLAQHPDASADEVAKFADEHGIIRLYGTSGGAGGSLIPGRATQAMINKRAAELRAEDPELSETDAFTQASREIKVESTPPTANRIDDIRNLNNQADNVIGKSNDIISFLENHKFGAGVAGKIMRGEEILGNIAGTTETDRAQMRRNILEVQEMAPQILSGRSGRPLASEQAKVDGIIAGLQSGDTSANTLRAYRELLKDIAKRKKDYQGRLEGAYQPGETSSGTGATGAPADSGKNKWESAPVVPGTSAEGPGKQSSNEQPPVPGAKRAPDGNYYVKDPQRPGKYLQVEMG
jgi:hypothetical protein